MNRVETIAKYFSIWEPTSIVETDQSRRISRAARSVTTLYYIRSRYCMVLLLLQYWLELVNICNSELY